MKTLKIISIITLALIPNILIGQLFFSQDNKAINVLKINVDKIINRQIKLSLSYIKKPKNEKVYASVFLNTTGSLEKKFIIPFQFEHLFLNNSTLDFTINFSKECTKDSLIGKNIGISLTSKPVSAIVKPENKQLLIIFESEMEDVNDDEEINDENDGWGNRKPHKRRIPRETNSEKQEIRKKDACKTSETDEIIPDINPRINCDSLKIYLTGILETNKSISKAVEKKEEPLNEFIRINTGFNLDFIGKNPFKLLYSDISIIKPEAFSLKESINGKSIFESEKVFGLYGRLFQFQGASIIDSKGRNNIFPEEFNGQYVINESVIKSIKSDKGDSLLLARTFNKRNSDIIKVRTYGAQIGIMTPLVYQKKSNTDFFYLSIGINFDGVLNQYEKDNNLKLSLVDTAKVLKSAYLNLLKPAIDSSSIKKKYWGTIGISLPMIWRLGSIDLKVLPTIDLITVGNQFLNSSKKIKSYSIQAVLTEIGKTGLNVGCEIRGAIGNSDQITPDIFNFFIAKTFNFSKLGEFLKL